MDTGNLYICKKAFAVGEERTNPAADPEHWGLFLPRGEKGERGEIGPQGEKGEQGLQGEQGIQGVKGDTGERGQSTWLTSDKLAIGGVPSITLSSIYKNSDSENLPQAGDIIISTHAESNGRRGYLLKNSNGNAFDDNGIGWVNPVSGSFQGEQGIQGVQGLKGEKGDKGDKASYRLRFVGLLASTGMGYYAPLDEGEIPLYMLNLGGATMGAAGNNYQIPPVLPLGEGTTQSFIGYSTSTETHGSIIYYLYSNENNTKVIFMGTAAFTPYGIDKLRIAVLSPQ